jgi:hypothetical protein
MGTDASNGNNGLFIFNNPRQGSPIKLRVIASDGAGWEHVSVSTHIRAPNWAEMCFIKSQFWDDEDCVMQLHPPRSEWVNNHSNCLHLWRPIGTGIPMPESWMVGYKELGVMV